MQVTHEIFKYLVIFTTLLPENSEQGLALFSDPGKLFLHSHSRHAFLLISVRTWRCLSSFVYFSPSNEHLLSTYNIPFPHYIRYWGHNIKQSKQFLTLNNLNKRMIILQVVSIYSVRVSEESTIAIGMIQGDHLLWASGNPSYWSSVVNDLIYSHQRKPWSFVQYLRRKTLNYWAW